ncbi:MAG: MFS transporter [Nocardioidaceae bacterium]|nr:MFS transporter [Nocardioidaceae bacterium]
MRAPLAVRRPADPPADTFDRRLTLPLILGSVLNPVNSSMIAVALVPIGTSFDAAPSATVWLVSGLYLATAIGQPVVGRLVDMFGPRRLYLVATALVGVAGVVGVLAPNLPTLVVSRVLLGLGTCAGYPSAMYLIRSENERTGRDSPAAVLTALSVANQTIAVVGPTLGGLLVDVGGWRSIFAVNIPLSLASLLLGGRRLPRHTVLDDRNPDASVRGLDLPGMTLFAVTLGALMFFLMSPSPLHLVLVALSVLAAAGLAWRELRAPTPFLDVRVLRGNGPLLATLTRQLLVGVTAYCLLYGFTQWLEDGRGLSAAVTGLVLLPMFATGIVATLVSGRRRRVRGSLVVAGVVLVAGVAALLLLDGDSPVWLLVLLSLVLGVPQGINSLANQTALYHQAEPARMGSSAGLLRTSMYLGAIVASAAVGVFFPHGADTPGLHDLSLFMLGCAVLLLLVTVADRSLRRIGAVPPTERQPA